MTNAITKILKYDIFFRCIVERKRYKVKNANEICLNKVTNFFMNQ
jgi:hypothetical protein